MLRFLLFCLLATSTHAAFFNSYDWEARQWKTNVQTVVALGGNTYVAATRFMLQSRSMGVRQTAVRANLFAGPNTNSMVRPIIKDQGAATETYTGTGPTYTEANGVTFTAGGTDMLGTGLNPTNFALNSAHLAIYLGGTPGQDANVPIGAQDFPNKLFFSMVCGFTAVGESVNIWTNAGYTGFANTNGTGYYIGTRTSAATNGVKMYRFGVLSGTSTLVGSSPPNTAGSATAGFYVMGLNSGGSPLLATGKAGRGYHVGSLLTATQAASWAAIWQRFQTTLGRQVTPF